MKVSINPFIPKTIFKFNPSSNYSRDALINHYLFTSHPFHLNDLMDGRSYSVDMRGVTPTLYNEIKRQIIEQSPLIVNGVSFNQMCSEIDKKYAILQKGICDCFFCFGGIVSLTTENRFNELLWSHYTHETGFMLEFDTQKLIESIIRNDLNKSIFKQLYFEPIQYKEHPVSISCVRYPNVQIINLYNSTQKSKEWDYEREWRIIATSYPFLGIPKELDVENKYTDISKRKLYYEFDAVKRIYLGKRFWSIEHVESKKELNDNVSIYVIRKELVPFIRMLENFKGELYMSGCCDCAEFRFGTDKCTRNVVGECMFEPEYYYLTRSFERIKSISMNENLVTVEYEGISKTRDEDF